MQIALKFSYKKKIAMLSYLPACHCTSLKDHYRKVSNSLFIVLTVCSKSNASSALQLAILTPVTSVVVVHSCPLHSEP